MSSNPSSNNAPKPGFRAWLKTEWHAHKPMMITLIVVILLFLGVGGYYLYKYFYPTPSPTNENNGNGDKDMPAEIPNPLPIKMGGTNATAELEGLKVMSSSSDGKIVEAPQDSRKLTYLDNLTASVQDQLDAIIKVKGTLRFTYDGKAWAIAAQTGCFSTLQVTTLPTTTPGRFTLPISPSLTEQYTMIVNATVGPCGIGCSSGNAGPDGLRVISFGSYKDQQGDPKNDMSPDSVTFATMNALGSYVNPANCSVVIV